jgi:hypothetical protein
MNKKILLILAIFVGAALSAHAQNIVVNPGFETGTLPPWTDTGDTSFTAVAGTFDGVAPHSGSFQLYSGPSSTDGFIDQTLPTIAGQGYNVSFWLANADTSGTNRFGMSLGGVILVPETSALPAFAYTQYSFTNVVPGANADLHFIFYNPPSYFFLDDVSVSAVPEPGTLGLVALGALGLVGAVRKRRSV